MVGGSWPSNSKEQNVKLSSKCRVQGMLSEPKEWGSTRQTLGQLKGADPHSEENPIQPLKNGMLLSPVYA